MANRPSDDAKEIAQLFEAHNDKDAADKLRTVLIDKSRGPSYFAQVLDLEKKQSQGSTNPLAVETVNGKDYLVIENNYKVTEVIAQRIKGQRYYQSVPSKEPNPYTLGKDIDGLFRKGVLADKSRKSFAITLDMLAFSSLQRRTRSATDSRFAAFIDRYIALQEMSIASAKKSTEANESAKKYLSKAKELDPKNPENAALEKIEAAVAAQFSQKN